MFPVEAMRFDTTMLLVLMYGMVNVLKFISTVVEFANRALSTWKVFAAYMLLANTFVVVTELDTTRFASGCLNVDILDRRPPSP